MTRPLCRFCGSELSRQFVDLGMGPMVSRYLHADELLAVEKFYPLKAYVCEQCLLVQLPDTESPEAIFGDYPYFSSVSKSWLEHVRRYVEMMVARYGFGAEHQVVEIASNDGYLLQYFKHKGVPVQGVEPAQNIARVANSKGIPTLAKFFGVSVAEELAEQGRGADLIVANNVLAHVPDINDFVAGLRRLLKPRGVITIEFPHLLRTMMENQFDQVFHEHASYLSLLAVEAILGAHDLTAFDAEELGTHGGSLRVFVKHGDDDSKSATTALEEVRGKERDYGMTDFETYDSFLQRVQVIKRRLLRLLIDIKEGGNSIVGYGAPGKGCVLLNYSGIGPEFLDYLVDLSPAKQGLYMPGVHLPILSPDKMRETQPKYVLILPWNLKDEIMDQLSYIREWGGRFVLPIPQPRVV